MAENQDDITIKVGFAADVKEIQVTIPDGDIPPYQAGQDLKVVGKRHPRVDALAKVTGKARYTYDRKLPEMLHGRIVRCPHPNATVKSIDTSEAEKMPGVKAVLKFPEIFRTNSVRFAWEGVAAVAAETAHQAEEAARRVVVDYEVLPFAVTLEQSMAENAPRVGRNQDDNVESTGQRFRESDEEYAARLALNKERVDVAFENAHAVVAAEFDTQVQTHASLETHGTVCHWEGEKLIIYASTQATFACRGEATSQRGAIRAADAQVICEYVGGGFGSKFGLGQEGAAAAHLAKLAGRPVKLMLDRREEHTSTGNRPDSKQKVELGVDKDGKIVALRADVWGTPGAGTRGAGAHTDAIYDIPLVDKREYGVRTNTGGARPMRAPGWPQGVFALEGIMDMAAEKLGMDPIEFRRKNDSHPVRAYEWGKAAELIDWKKRRNQKAGSQRGPLKTGVGCAATMWFNAGGGGAAAIVRIHRNGTVEVRNGAQDIGTGTRTTMAIITAEELGLGVTDIQTYIGNTDDPPGPGSGGSTTIGSLTPAVRLAAHQAGRKLLDFIAEEKELDAAELSLAGGQIHRKGKPMKPELTFTQACALLDEDVLEARAARPTLSNREPNYDGYSSTNAGVQMAEVEVDTETGQVRVTRMVAVQDCGKVINLMAAESQVRGGVIQGVSYALFERRVMDRQEGRMVNPDFEFYKIAGPADCPEITVEMVDVANGRNNTSVMGLGEPPKVATAAAIANAVYNAIGVRITSLPITPKKVLAALAAKEKK